MSLFQQLYNLIANRLWKTSVFVNVLAVVYPQSSWYVKIFVYLIIHSFQLEASNTSEAWNSLTSWNSCWCHDLSSYDLIWFAYEPWHDRTIFQFNLFKLIFFHPRAFPPWPTNFLIHVLPWPLFDFHFSITWNNSTNNNAARNPLEFTLCESLHTVATQYLCTFTWAKTSSLQILTWYICVSWNSWVANCCSCWIIWLNT